MLISKICTVCAEVPTGCEVNWKLTAGQSERAAGGECDQTGVTAAFIPISEGVVERRARQSSRQQVVGFCAPCRTNPPEAEEVPDSILDLVG
jgi:hypothetical protein